MQIFLIILKQFLLYFPLVLCSFIALSLMKIPALSLESAYICAPAASIVFLKFFGGAVSSFPLFLAVLLISILAGAFVGLVYSLMIVFGKIPYLLSAILVLGIFNGITQLILGSSVLSFGGMQDIFTYLDFGFADKELTFLILSFIFQVILSLLFLKTEIGISLALYGDNPNFFENYKISKSYVLVFGLLLSHAIAGFAGTCISQSNGFVDITMGNGIVLLSITALILGKAVLPRKMHRSIFIPIVGTLIYFLLQQLLLLIGFDLKYFTMIQSLVVLAVLYKIYRAKFSSDFTLESENLGV